MVNSESGKRFTLDVRDTSSNKTSLYRGSYAVTGKLLKQMDCGVEPLDNLELLPAQSAQPAVLVGYQHIWVHDHANTVTTARSVWQWTDGTLQLNEIHMLSPTSPEQYADALQRLASRPPADAIMQAAALYTRLIAGQPPSVRDQAFQRFLAFHHLMLAHAGLAFSDNWRGHLAMMLPRGLPGLPRPSIAFRRISRPACLP